MFRFVVFSTFIFSSVALAAPVPFERYDLETLPEVAALMPAEQEAFGLNIRVFDAGITNGNLSADAFHKSQDIGFFFAYRVLDKRKSEWRQRVGYKNSVASDGTTFSVNQSFPDYFRGAFEHSSAINPRWQWIQNYLEVAAPNLSEAQRGVFNTPFQLDLSLPKAGTVALNQEIAGVHGTKIRLLDISKNTEGRGWKGRLNVEIPEDIKAISALRPTQYTTDTNPVDKIKAGQFSLYFDTFSKGEGTFRIDIPDENVTTLGLSGIFYQQSNAWRDESKYKTLVFRVPVSPVIAKLPKVDTPQNIIKMPQGRLQVDYFDQIKSGYIRGELWFQSEVTPQKESYQIEIEEGKFRELPEQNIDVHLSESEGKFYDRYGRIVESNETYLNIWEKIAPNTAVVHFSGILKSTPKHETINSFSGVPVPSKDQIHQFDEDRFVGPQLSLRKVGWLSKTSAEFQKQKSHFNPQKTLLLVFDVQKVWSDQEAITLTKLKGITSEDGQGIPNDSMTLTQQGDAFTNSNSPNTFTVCIQLDSVKPKELNLALLWREIKRQSIKTPFEVEIPIRQIDEW